MTISITKSETGIVFSFEEGRPSVIIYNTSDVAVISDDIITTMEEAEKVSQLVSLAGIFVESRQAEGDALKKKTFDVLYINEMMPQQKSAKYSPRNVLRRMYSNQIVSVDMKKRVRFQFTSFGFKDGKIIINYKPVIW